MEMDVDALPQDIINTGQTVAACVPYSKRKKEWIMSSVEKWLPEEKEYIVKDLFPESKRKQDWRVKQHELTIFPAVDEKYPLGTKVLSLWLMENNEWSSMFYEAEVVDCVENVVNLKFDGEDKIYSIMKEKVVKLPKKTITDNVKPLVKDSRKIKIKESAPSIPNRKIKSPERIFNNESKRPSKNEDITEKKTKKLRLSPESSNSESNAIDTPAIVNDDVNMGNISSPTSTLSPVYKPCISRQIFNGCSVLEKKMLKYQQLLAIRQQQSNTCE